MTKKIPVKHRSFVPPPATPHKRKNKILDRKRKHKSKHTN